MPSTSAAQHRWIEWVRHDPKALAKTGMSQSKADEWAKADTGSPWKHHAAGGGIFGYDGGGAVDDYGGDPALSNSAESVYYSLAEKAAGGILRRDDGGGIGGVVSAPSSGSVTTGELDAGLTALAQALSGTSLGNKIEQGAPSPDAGSTGGRPNWSQDPQTQAATKMYGYDQPSGSHARGGILGRPAGGSVPTPGPGGGPAPTAANANPMMKQAYQRLLSLPPEKLQELAARVGSGSPQGQIIQQALQLQHMNPGAAAQQAQPQPAPAQPSPAMQQPGILGAGAQPVARGGDVGAHSHGFIAAHPTQAPEPRHLQYGGEPLGMSLSMASPWWERSEERGMDSSQYLRGPTAGRADNVTTTAPGGAYVMPADIVAGVGEGNGEFGTNVLDAALRSFPHGIKPGPRGGRPTMPRAPSPRYERDAKGGGVQGDTAGIGRPVPVKLSHGEMVISPPRVLAIGQHILRQHGGTGRSVKLAMKAGHDFLDEFVRQLRQQHIEKLKRLPGPTR